MLLFWHPSWDTGNSYLYFTVSFLRITLKAMNSPNWNLSHLKSTGKGPLQCTSHFSWEKLSQLLGTSVSTSWIAWLSASGALVGPLESRFSASGANVGSGKGWNCEAKISRTLASCCLGERWELWKREGIIPYNREGILVFSIGAVRKGILFWNVTWQHETYTGKK